MRRAISIALLFVASRAFADEPAPAVRQTAPPASLALPSGKLAVTLTVEIEASAGKLGEPVAVAPDVSYGATRDLTLSIVHSKFAVTGFRAASGGGLCFSDACPLYNNAGAEALYSLRRGAVSLAAVCGIHALDFERDFYDLKVGARARYSRGRASLVTSPSVLIAMTERTDAMGARLNKDLLFVPLLASYKLTRPLSAGVGSGFKGSLTQLGSTWEVPLGVVATYAIDPRITVGASLIFGKLIGGADAAPMAPPATGADYRGTQVWVVVTP